MGVPCRTWVTTFWKTRSVTSAPTGSDSPDANAGHLAHKKTPPPRTLQ